MNESGVWQYLRKGLMPFNVHMTRIESSAGNGVPDVTIGVPGKQLWVELKYIAEWPKRNTTKVKLPLRPEQKHWIKARGELSGDVWVLVRIQSSFFLMKWHEALDACNGWTFEEYCNKFAFSRCWVDRINFNELYRALKGDCDGI